MVVAIIIIGASVPPEETADQSTPAQTTAQSTSTDQENSTSQKEDEPFDIVAWQREQAVDIWGNLSPKESRYTYLGLLPDILTEQLQRMAELDKLTAGYLEGKVPRDEMLAQTMEFGMFKSETLDKAYLLTLLAPDDKELNELHLSLSSFESGIGNVALMVRRAVEDGERNRGINIYLDMVNEDWSKVNRLLEDMIADYRFSNPKEANALQGKIESIKSQFL